MKPPPALSPDARKGWSRFILRMKIGKVSSVDHRDNDWLTEIDHILTWHNEKVGGPPPVAPRKADKRKAKK